MSVFESIVLGLVQGLTEFIPVSSSGHLILAREVFGLSSTTALSFDAILQLATVAAVIIYFLRDLPALFSDKQLLYALFFGTLPALVLGFFLEGSMETVFRSSVLVSWTLLIGAVIMFMAEKFGRHKLEHKAVPDWMEALFIGFFQSLALVPGISRSGATISGGLFLGLSRASAARFSFLLSVPIITGSGLKKLLDLYQNGALMELGAPIFAGSLAAFVSGLVAVNFLLKYLKEHSLTPFIVYRIILALLIFLLV